MHFLDSEGEKLTISEISQLSLQSQAISFLKIVSSPWGLGVRGVIEENKPNELKSSTVFLLRLFKESVFSQGKNLSLY